MMMIRKRKRGEREQPFKEGVPDCLERKRWYCFPIPEGFHVTSMNETSYSTTIRLETQRHGGKICWAHAQESPKMKMALV